CQQHYSYPYSF
nr:immunoglobulin light chain junction region [Macaca mulatta]MOW43813.1 immunoglobulin light chain junction region [Macaca mulatta]MOW61935.1 immunoglobulin light chain junction region [Macaca mulatta]MOW62397.1 immunoglobulin light chain junction region [Macaca mulatta]MOW62400.1 immunoglobulin light chain junction region [Macaca mulatta]